MYNFGHTEQDFIDNANEWVIHKHTKNLLFLLRKKY